MTFLYRPSHRQKAKQNIDYGQVYIGISGKRSTERPLQIKRADGKPFVFHPSCLTYTIIPEGIIYVELLPFRAKVDTQFVDAVAGVIRGHRNLLLPILASAHISHIAQTQRICSLEEAITPELGLFSPVYYFPAEFSRGLNELIVAFIALYPLLDACISLAEGHTPLLRKRLEQFKQWWLATIPAETTTEEEATATADARTTFNMPGLESYAFIRPGIWWAVLARDGWRCCSCGRSAKVEGIILEVDHILPRSKGGTDDTENLQTLCRKCNIGKSNRDHTDLRIN
jgi:hypothetical protein